jgi:hypothetical protein
VPDLPESTNDIQGIKDILDVSIDPTDPSHVVFSSYEEGLVELRGGEVVRVLNAENSSLQTSLVGGTPRSAVGGIDFDRAGNLWFTNPWVSGALHVMLPDGSTVAMDLGDEGQNLLFSDVEVTRDGYVWAVLREEMASSYTTLRALQESRPTTDGPSSPLRLAKADCPPTTFSVWKKTWTMKFG